jgi:outer membrane protein with beta-barrel domain
MKQNLKLSVMVLALVCVCAIKSNAQNMELGLRYEPEFSVLMNSNDKNASPALEYTSHFTYFNLGVGTVFNFNKNVGLAIDVLFSREGQAFSGNFDDTNSSKATYASVVRTQAYLNNLVITGDYVALAELNFIKLPIMLSLTTDNTNPIFLTLQVGPQINFLYNVAQEVNHTDEAYPNTNITPIDLYKSITIDGVAALGLGFNITPHMVFTAQFRYDYGFEDIENKNVMVSYYGAPATHFYSSDRQATHTATYGLLIGLNIKL